MSEEPLKTGCVSWQSPSNIALVKYWGKYGRQYPKNPSISFTLSNAHTTTKVDWKYYSSNQEDILQGFKFEGKEKPTFAEKIKQHLNNISDVFPLIQNLQLEIESENSFPHSSGIASSASSMSALAICLLDIEKEVKNKTEIDLNMASNLSRLGSGSACRSVFPKIAIWGKDENFPTASNDYAIEYHEGIDPIFHTFHDDILIISNKEKSVSSRAGHALMEDNPYGPSRFEQAHRNLNDIVDSMKSGDLEKFGKIVESEALTLHALMMASDPPYMLMEPNTIEAIRKIQAFRVAKNIPVYFTLDAGPNIHMLYPSKYVQDISVFKESLRPFCADGLIIDDQVGNGPKKLI